MLDQLALSILTGMEGCSLQPSSLLCSAAFVSRAVLDALSHPSSLFGTCAVADEGLAELLVCSAWAGLGLNWAVQRGWDSSADRTALLQAFSDSDAGAAWDVLCLNLSELQAALPALRAALRGEILAAGVMPAWPPLRTLAPALAEGGAGDGLHMLLDSLA
jgi:hypothetical protein